MELKMFSILLRFVLFSYLIAACNSVPVQKTNVDLMIDSIFGSPIKEDKSTEEPPFDEQTPICQCLPPQECDDQRTEEKPPSSRRKVPVDASFLDVCEDSGEVCCKHPKLDEELSVTTRPIKWNPDECGFRNAQGVGFRILNNDPSGASFGEFPWMIAILKEEVIDDGRKLTVFVCGGSLIHKQIVLTAAHCVYNYSRSKDDLSQMKIRAGDLDTQSRREFLAHQERYVRSIIIHEEFYPGALYFDMALLILEKPVVIMEHIDIICLPEKDANYDHERCIATGWGKNKFGKNGTYHTTLRKVELPIVPSLQCLHALQNTRLGINFKLHRSFLCAGGEYSRDTCQGDGGSPLVCPIPIEKDEYFDPDLSMKPQHFVQVGIVSWGIGCAIKDIPAVYANVPFIRTWIDSKIKQFNESVK